MQGWSKLHRELMNKAIWIESTPEQKSILITLLMMANHKEKEWEWKVNRLKAKPGQFIASLNGIVGKCGKGISVENVRTALKRFENYGFLTSESTNRNRLITIINWNEYQGNTKEQETISKNYELNNSPKTTNAPTSDNVSENLVKSSVSVLSNSTPNKQTNKRLTSNQQA